MVVISGGIPALEVDLASTSVESPATTLWSTSQVALLRFPKEDLSRARRVLHVDFLIYRHVREVD